MGDVRIACTSLVEQFGQGAAATAGGVQSNPVPGSGAGLVDDEDAALQDLLELQASGCNVVLPSLAPRPLLGASAPTCDEAALLIQATMPAESVRRTGLSQLREVQAAKDELEDLERCGLKVKR